MDGRCGRTYIGAREGGEGARGAREAEGVDHPRVERAVQPAGAPALALPALQVQQHLACTRHIL